MPDVDIVGKQVYFSWNTVNLLFLGDGFAATDKPLFDQTVTEVSRRIRNIRPFNLVKDSFCFFKYFTASPDSGISCDNDVDVNGMTLPDIGALASIGLLEEKQSALQLTYGYPSGDPNNSLSRVIRPKTTHIQRILTLIRTLSHPNEPAGNSAIPWCWDPAPGASPYQSKDCGLVIVLVNDDKHGGAGSLIDPVTNRTYGATVSLGNAPSFNITGATGAVDGATGKPLFAHTPNAPRDLYDRIADIAAHEIGHSRFGLADEYTSQSTPKAGDQNPIQEPNATSSAEVSSPAGPFTHIKWNRPRYPGSPNGIISPSMIAYITANGPTSPQIPNPQGQEVALPPKPFWPTARYPQQIIGIYEGARYEHFGLYRPAGTCKMRVYGWWWHPGLVGVPMPAVPVPQYVETDFCYVCKYHIIEQLDKNLLPVLANLLYPK